MVSQTKPGERVKRERSEVKSQVCDCPRNCKRIAMLDNATV